MKSMATKESHAIGIQRAVSGIVLVAIAVGGVLALLYFWNQLLRPGELGSASLPLVALIAGIAATFNPCGLPALPGFITLLGGNTEDAGVRQRLRLSLGASLGAMSLVLVLGIIVAVVGSGTKGLIAPYIRWVQLAVGLFLVGLASLHMTDQTSRLPFVGSVMNLGGRMWNQAMGKPTIRGSYLFGGGFVLVGVG